MTKKILVVDDSDIIRKVIDSFLKQTDYEVTLTSSAAEFLEKFKQIKPNLCLIDLNIDSINDGQTMIKAIRNKIGSSLPIIVISSKAESHDINDALQAGANDYICKPVEKSLLIAKISSLLDSYNSEQLPIFRIPSVINSSATLNFPLEVKRINEFGIELYSDHYIYLNSYLNLNGTIVSELDIERMTIRVKVISCKVDTDSSKHIIFVEFAEDDEELLSAVRNYIS